MTQRVFTASSQVSVSRDPIGGFRGAITIGQSACSMLDLEAKDKGSDASLGAK